MYVRLLLNKLTPKMLAGGIAPDNLLKGICCNCKEGKGSVKK